VLDPTARSRNAPLLSTDLILLIAVTLWALNFSVIKVGLAQINPLAFPVLRFGIGGAVMMVILKWREGTFWILREDIPYLVLTALFGIALNQLCLVYSLVDTGASDVALLGASGPLITAFVAAVVGWDVFDSRIWVGVVLGLVGVVTIVIAGPGSVVGHSTVLGDLLALSATVCSSVSLLPIRRLMRRYTTWRILSLDMLIGSLMLAPIAIPSLVGQDYAHVSASGWGALAYSIIFTGIVTNVLYVTAIRRVGPSRAAIFGYLQAFLGALFAVVLLNERVTGLQVAGGVVVIGSVVLSRRASRHA
jgi:drug/metabolite transporter (DMT)-like permease